MAAIAREARVALKTVYVAFETKSGVLRALWNTAPACRPDDVPVAQLAIYQAVLDEPDPDSQLRLNARNSRAGKERVGALADVIRQAAPGDPDIATLWERIGTEYHANQRVIVASLEDKHALRPELDVDRGADILWTINHPTVWQLLVRERGWTADEYERWSGDLACAPQLLGERRRGAST